MRNGCKRRPQIARREPVQALRLRAEAAAERPRSAGRRKACDGAHPELVQAVAKHRGDAQPTRAALAPPAPVRRRGPRITATGSSPA